MPHVLLLIKKENQTLLPLHEHPPKSQHVKILQQVHHVYVKIVFEYIYPAEYAMYQGMGLFVQYLRLILMHPHSQILSRML